ncbi:MAG: glutamate 5-kinase [Spirochaetaceae bacterium]|jgi:glutamate 5-kinase|nr:glutamate 5-kinase [Spirochaetaceae bacterium]
MIPQLIEKARKIVIKFGSNTLAGVNGRINDALLAEFAEQAAALIKQGKQIVIVSSGAQVAGLSAMDRWERKRDLHYRQALCAVGQVKLMHAWERAFSPQGIQIAQILLTRDDFADNTRTLNMRNTLFTLVDEGIVPIINENDTVSVEEIKIGDNDTLAAQSAILWSADLLVMFSDIDGLYDRNPKQYSDAKLVSEVRDIAAARQSVSTAGNDGGAGEFGTGGIVTKLDAAEQVVSYGIPMILAHGGRKRALETLAAGTGQGTAFLA